MTKTAIHVDHIARIEGHGNVHVVIEDGEVKTVEMNVVEPARLFESMVRGRRFEESALHRLAHLRHLLVEPCGHRPLAIERVFGVEVSAAHARAARAAGVRLLPAEPRDASVRVRRARLRGHVERVPAGRDRSGAVRAGARPQGARQRAVHEGGRPHRASHHGGGGRLHARDHGRRSTSSWRQDGRGHGLRARSGGSVPLASRCPPSPRRATCWPWWRTTTTRWSAPTRASS